MKKVYPSSARQLAGSFLSQLKAAGADQGVWSIRGKTFARVMVAARDARLSGAEWSVLSTIALHLHHLGRSEGFMTLATIADDAMVTQRTVRNALRTLGSCGFVHARQRSDGQLELLLDPRFRFKTPVPANAVPGQRRRSTSRKKISKSALRLVSHTLPLRSTYSIQRRNIPARPKKPGRRRESTGDSSKPGTERRNGYRWPTHGPPKAG